MKKRTIATFVFALTSVSFSFAQAQAKSEVSTNTNTKSIYESSPGYVIRLSDLPDKCKSNCGGVTSAHKELNSWLSGIRDLIVNSSDLHKLKEETDFKPEFYKTTYSFCIDKDGYPVGFHALSRDKFTELDEKMSQVVENAAPFPPAPNNLHWNKGGMRVELTVRKDYVISVSPEWPNTRLAALSSRTN